MEADIAGPRFLTSAHPLSPQRAPPVSRRTRKQGAKQAQKILLTVVLGVHGWSHITE